MGRPFESEHGTATMWCVFFSSFTASMVSMSVEKLHAESGRDVAYAAHSSSGLHSSVTKLKLTAILDLLRLSCSFVFPTVSRRGWHGFLFGRGMLPTRAFRLLLLAVLALECHDGRCSLAWLDEAYIYPYDICVWMLSSKFDMAHIPVPVPMSRARTG